MPRAFDVMILHLSQDDKLSSCGLWMFQISTLANWETEVYELLKLFDSSGDKHDEKDQQLLFDSQAGTSSRFCHESHDLLTFLMTRLPISWFLVKYRSEIKCFFVPQKRARLLSLNHDSPRVYKRRELEAVQRRQLESSWRFCMTLVGFMFLKCDEMS